jgi:hypothetical protein
MGFVALPLLERALIDVEGSSDEILVRDLHWRCNAVQPVPRLERELVEYWLSFMREMSTTAIQRRA